MRPSGSRRYPASWRVVRIAHLRREPLCRFCAERGVVTAATEVDHIDGDRMNHVPANLRSACKPCHSRRTARDQAFGRRPPGGTR
jgi:5-methylcytosine-specific restriction protein A